MGKALTCESPVLCVSHETKGGDTYMLRWRLGDEAAVVRALARWVKDSTCDFDIADGMEMIMRCREEVAKA